MTTQEYRTTIARLNLYRGLWAHLLRPVPQAASK
jgi:hypothetical protein